MKTAIINAALFDIQTKSMTFVMFKSFKVNNQYRINIEYLGLIRFNYVSILQSGSHSRDFQVA